ncbi:MAG: class I SAM-dependent methyltransferase [Acidimicrobiia bacterium]|nr:class I SAM-dependent methyltransferase [Acidimicrobiia bacterium]
MREATLTWDTPTEFTLGNTRFVAASLEPGQSTPERFLLRKPPHMVDAYAALLEDLRPDVVVDLGIFDGACAAFVAKYCAPTTLAAIDILESFPALDEFVISHGLEESLTIHPGVDQADRDSVLRAVDAAAGEQPVDLVIDDASHLYHPTMTSFEALFPRLRSGGRFIIEDWAIGPLASERVQRALIKKKPKLKHDSETRTLIHEFVLRTTSAHTDFELLDPIAEAVGFPPTKDPITSILTTFLLQVADGSLDGLRSFLEDFLAPLPPRRPFADVVLELLRLHAIGPDIITDITVTEWWVEVVRGPQPLHPRDFRVGEGLGRKMRMRC